MQKLSQNSPKRDPRVVRTRQVLLDALLDLLDEKRFDEVSIGDITTRAKVNRTTFYSHFEDKYQLLLYYVKEMLDELVTEIDGLEAGQQHSMTDQVPIPLVLLFEQIGSHANLYRNILGRHGNAEIAAHVRTYMETIIAKWLKTHDTQTHTSVIPSEIVSRYIASARIGIIEWWLDNHKPCTARQIAEWVWYLTEHPVIDL